jgi:glutamate-1-semialdehyde 2,1-aminomutase
MAEQTSLEQYAAKFPKSRALYERAKGIFRNGITHDGRYIKPFPIYITHAKGAHKWDVDGYKYIDYFGGHGAMMLGHAHPAIVKAVTEQIAKGTQWAACHELEIEWGELIKKLIPSAERIEFTSSGTEANMLAIRLARAFTDRKKVVRFRGQMGGWYDALMVGGAFPWDVPTTNGLLPAVAENTIAIPINDEKALEKTLSKQDVAILVCEPWGAYSGTAGIAPSFYGFMREVTRQYGTLLHFDEVVSAFRYSPGGVQVAKGIIPDLTSLGKNVTGGLPGAGAVVGRADAMDLLSFKEDDEWNRFKRVPHAGTFNANPLCAAAGVAALKILATGEPQKRANELATALRQAMELVMKRRGLNACAYGDGGAVHLYFGSCKVREECNRVVCLNSTKVRPANVGFGLFITLTLNGVGTINRAVDFFVSAVHNEEDISKSIDAFDKALGTMTVEGTLKDYLTLRI